ncbi:histidinol-phosphate transaminase [Acuticoccus sediminis]|uniref:Histidinol-phosphate aminotransferase n=1 Tax=Acuticoccus sediminis TaxID=2184697 RepID=A0A8B2P1B1_9HYPH|nr:histidinol-phosphate transaminase [Acuticoccus sediminis]RAI02570.1 histidinol-phosphate transaminase [Acuticoccus sediminis]
MPTSPATLRSNPHFATLPAYNAGLSDAEASRLSGGKRLVRLASNENPYGPSPAAITELQRIAAEAWRYPEGRSDTLRRAIADHHGVDEDRIVVGNGSETLIAALSRAFLQPGAGVLTVTPGFGLHEIEPLAEGADVTKVPMTGALEFDIGRLTEAMDEAPRLVFLSSPSNPVGTTLSRDALHRLLAAVRPGTLFVFDEAYAEFRRDEDAFDSLALATEAGVDFVTLRTFSKAHGLAGLRIGYGVASSAAIAQFMRLALTPFNVNVAAQNAAVAALHDEAWMRASVGRIRAERDRMAAALRERGLWVARSEANFVFFDTGRDSAPLAAALLREGVIVKPWGEAGYTTFMRVTAGRPEDTDAFLAAFDSARVAAG